MGVAFEALTELLIVSTTARSRIGTLLVASCQVSALFTLFANARLLLLSWLQRSRTLWVLIISRLACRTVDVDLQIRIYLDFPAALWSRLLLLLASGVEAGGRLGTTVSLGRHGSLRLGLRRTVVEVVNDVGYVRHLLLTSASSVGKTTLRAWLLA